MNSSTDSTMVPVPVISSNTLAEASDRPTAPSTGQNSSVFKPGRKNMLALKGMLYQRVEENDFEDSDKFKESMSHLRPKRSKLENTVQDSYFEILDGSFSDIRVIIESAQVGVHPTPDLETDLISSNSTSLPPNKKIENLSSVKESTRLLKQLATTLKSKRDETMELELDEMKRFCTIRDRILDILVDIDNGFSKRIKDLKENSTSLNALIDLLQSVRAERLQSIRRLRKKRQEYRDFRTKIF